jgi:tetratricopeptide (TPR) repeat protein
MRTLVRIVATRLVASHVGRVILTVTLLLIGAVSFLAYALVSANGSAANGITALVTGIVFVVLGLLMCVFTLRIGRLQDSAQQRNKTATSRVHELQASGQLLPIPGLPPLPAGLSPEDVARVAAYADQMARIHWGDQLRVSAADAPEVFNRTVARVRRIRGDWDMLREPIGIFAGLPRPLCYVGAAEVMHRLSYHGGTTFVPEGLRQGLRFIARSQYTEAMQPDALVIRTKLLAASTSKIWLELADQTLERLREVDPGHRRLPDAAATIYLRRGQHERAIACYDQLLANPPSADEAFVAQANRAAALERLQRYDEAIEAYRHVLQVDPNDAWAWHNMSLLLLNQGRLEEALQANTRALSIMSFGNAQMSRKRILAAIARRDGVRAEVEPD